jgi:stage II sporulation protein D
MNVPRRPHPTRACRARVLLTRTAAAATAAAVLLAGCGSGPTPALMAATAPPTVRVRLGTVRTSAHLRLRAGSWSMRSVAGSAFEVHGRTALDAVLRAGRAGVVVGGRPTGARVLRIRATLDFGLDGRSYRGDLVVHAAQGRLLLVNVLDMETYVAGVIGNEVAPHAPPATCRAQAVAARTWAWMRVHRSGAAREPFDVKDGQGSQVYTGMSVPAVLGLGYAQMRRRTAETRGVIVTWHGRPFRTYYASTCGGHTTDPRTSGLQADGAEEPLRGVACSFCRTSKYFAWTRKVSDAEVVAGLARRHLPVSLPIRAIELTRFGPGGWLAQATVRYGAQAKARTIPGYELRRALGLRSHHILSVRRADGGWVVTGRGWGHGVGMCQWGALEMGRKGFSESEILRYYYPGVDFTKVY